VTIGECCSHAKIAAQMGPIGGKGSSEQALARRLFPRLEENWLLIADRGFHNWAARQAAAATGAALLWRVKSDLRLPVLELLPVVPIHRSWSGRNLNPARRHRSCPHDTGTRHHARLRSGSSTSSHTQS
jgi:hypothetical protein